MVVERLMVVSATETVNDTSQNDRILERLDRSIERVVLQRQDPISGLLPASTAHTVHGDYGDAWVRDCVYSIQCVWGLPSLTDDVMATPAVGPEWNSGCWP